MYSTKPLATILVAIFTLVLTACGTGATPAPTATTISAEPTTPVPAATETSVPTIVPPTSEPATVAPTETSAPTMVPATSAPATTEPTTPPTATASPAATTPATTPTNNQGGTPTRIEFAPNASTASVLGDVGGTVTQSYLLEASAGQFMVMSVTSPNNNVYLTLVAPDGSPLARAQNGTQDVNLELPQNGDYRITVSTPSNQPMTTYSLDMLVTFEQTSIQHFRRIQFAPNATEASVTGTITVQGADQYLLEASAGQQFVASVTSPNSDVYFSLVSPSGEPLARAQNGTQSVDLILPESGDYTILISVPADTSDTTYTFTVSIVSTPTVVPIRFEAGATQTTVTSYTQEGTFPRYTFEALQGQTARISITSEGDVANWGLTAPDGTPIKRIASEARSAEFELPLTGEYSISIGSPTAGASYQLTLEILPS